MEGAAGAGGVRLAGHAGEPEELGATGAFLASDGAAAITGQVLYVDSGYQIMGM